MRKFFIPVLVVLMVLLIGGGYWVWRQRRPEPVTDATQSSTRLQSKTVTDETSHPIEATSDIQAYGLQVVGAHELDTYLTQHGIWQTDGFDLPNGLHIKGPVTGLRVVYSQATQPFNQETGAKGLVGSVNVENDHGTLVLTVESLPAVWGEVDRSMHIDAQVARVINDIGSKDSHESLDAVLQMVRNQPRMFLLYEK